MQHMCLIIVLLFPFTNQLSCLTNYSINQTSSSNKICKGRIIAYYIGNNYPKYINYTLGTIGDTFERKNEDDIHTYGLDNFRKYQVMINANNEETYLIADIYCTTSNACALDEIRKLSSKYTHQINPYTELKHLIYIDPPLKNLFCYDLSIDGSKPCDHHHSVCVSYSKDLKQECSSESTVHLHEEFILTSPEQVEFNLMTELVRCNRNNCNQIDTLTTIQNISRDYVYGNLLRTNQAEKLQISSINLLIFIIIIRFE